MLNNRRRQDSAERRSCLAPEEAEKSSNMGCGDEEYRKNEYKKHDEELAGRVVLGYHDSRTTEWRLVWWG